MVEYLLSSRVPVIVEREIEQLKCSLVALSALS